MKKLIIFDLDGTLLNTIACIARRRENRGECAPRS